MIKKTQKKKQESSEAREVLGEVKRHFDMVIESVKDEVKIIAEQYMGISEKLDSHTEMIGSMAEDIEIIKSDIEFIKGALKKKVDYEEFVVLERRLTLLESKTRR